MTSNYNVPENLHYTPRQTLIENVYLEILEFFIVRREEVIILRAQETQGLIFDCVCDTDLSPCQCRAVVTADGVSVRR